MGHLLPGKPPRWEPDLPQPRLSFPHSVTILTLSAASPAPYKLLRRISRQLDARNSFPFGEEFSIVTQFGI
jgi:hypothetical protein